jgi:hypothetical protein
MDVEDEAAADGGAAAADPLLDWSGADDLLAGASTAPISQVDAWAVVRGYFDEKGLVRQQLD